ncbi:MAG: hypothetical protein JWN98_1311 [Abditibacteriota bacterium]|nr:hypothetical protein [Abditibacteriota bacterium]
MKRREIFLFVLPFLILAVGFGTASHRQALQEERDARQQKFLNRRFSSVKLQSGRIVMTPKTHFHPSFDVQTPKALSVGDTFEYSDRHWHGIYRITGLESDGITVQYNYEGNSGR